MGTKRWPIFRDDGAEPEVIQGAYEMLYFTELESMISMTGEQLERCQRCEFMNYVGGSCIVVQPSFSSRLKARESSGTRPTMRR